MSSLGYSASRSSSLGLPYAVFFAIPFLEPLPDRAVAGHGQGGGGALSIEELTHVLRVGSEEPRLLVGTILH